MSKEISRRDVLKAGVTGAAVAAGATTVFPKVASAKTKKIRWRMQTHWPTGVNYYKEVYIKFTERVNAAANGELVITPLPSGSIVPTKDVFEALGRGLFEMALIWPTYWMGKVPVCVHVNGQLFAWDTVPEMFSYYYEMGAIDIFREAYKEHGVRFVGPVPQTGVALYSKRPIKTIDDFKGFKVRSTGIAAQVFQKAGATPVFFPAEEVYQALQTGVCEGAHWGSVACGWDMKFQEVTDYIIMPYLANVNNAEIIMNQKKWDELPDHLKAIVQECANSAAQDYITWSGYNDIIDSKLFVDKKYGELCHMDPEAVAQMRKYSIDVVDEYSKKDPKYCKKAGDLLKELMKMTGKM